MERIDPLSERHSIVSEHKLRYEIAAAAASGRVLDCACGLGYGSEIILGQAATTDYTGVDISEEAIIEARERYASTKAAFLSANAERLPFPDATFDTIISLETLEHLPSPENTINELCRVLKPEGLLIASAPTSEHDDYCESVFGKNSHHLSRFTEQALKALLNKIGPHKICLSRITVTASLDSPDSQPTLSAGANLRKFGSYIAFARKGQKPLPIVPSTVTPFMTLVEVESEITADYDRIVADRDRSITAYKQSDDELRRALQNAELLANDRLTTSSAYQQADAELRNALKFAEELAVERLKTVESYKSADCEIRAAFQKAEQMINDRDQAIQAYKNREEELRLLVSKLELELSSRN